MPKDLSRFFNPESIAVVGASRSPEKVGAIILKNIQNSGFKGSIYPINPNADYINNLKCYKDIKSLPEVVDLAVISVPVEDVIPAINELGLKGVLNVVIITAGFKEIGGDGVKLEKELIAAAEKFRINILGPNCLGFVNKTCPVNATFGQPVDYNGNLRFVTQSGAIAASIFDYCQSTGLGFSDFVTLGNKAGINENDVLNYFQYKQRTVKDPENELSNVNPVGLYLESITNGREFLSIASQIGKKDPVFIIKPGKTSAGAHAMQSHTGAMAGEDVVFDSVLKEAGIIRCDTLEDFIDTARAFAWENIPEGNKVAVISNAGGPAVLTADAVIKEGLQLAEFDEQTREQLLHVLPRTASIFNPVDILGDALADRYAQAAEIILSSGNADGLIFILTPQVMTQINKTAEIIGFLSKKYNKPILCSFIGGSLVAEGEEILNAHKIPSFRFPERAVAALGTMWKWQKGKVEIETISLNPQAVQDVKIDRAKEIVRDAVKRNQKTLDNLEVNDLISSSGIYAPSTALVDSLDMVKDFVQKYGYPLVLKLSAPGLLHKKDIGGVVTGIKDEEHLESAWNVLQGKVANPPPEFKGIMKIQAQKEVAEGIEVIVGIKYDPTFGHVLLFGAGGTWTDLIADRNLHLLPIELDQIKKLVEGSKIYGILKGSRGEPPYALDKLYDLIWRLGKLAAALPEVTDLEINPVIVTLNDVWAVDGKVMLQSVEIKQDSQKAVGVQTVEVKSPEVKPVTTTPGFHIATATKHEILATTYHYYEFHTEDPFNLKSGQFVSVKVSNDAIRCYSVAGHTGSNIFSLLIDIKPGGPGSKFFEHLNVGDKITYLGPIGQFNLKMDDGAETLLFFGTGSGVAPLKEMIETALFIHKSTLPLVLYIGLNYPEDIFLFDYFTKLSQEYPNFKFKIAIWKPNESWKGDIGFVTDLLKKDYPDTSKCSAYLCGNKFMLDDVTKVMIERGCPKERVYSEKL